MAFSTQRSGVWQGKNAYISSRAVIDKFFTDKLVMWHSYNNIMVNQPVDSAISF